MSQNQGLKYLILGFVVAFAVFISADAIQHSLDTLLGFFDKYDTKQEGLIGLNG